MTSKGDNIKGTSAVTGLKTDKIIQIYEGLVVISTPECTISMDKKVPHHQAISPGGLQSLDRPSITESHHHLLLTCLHVQPSFS